MEFTWNYNFSFHNALIFTEAEIFFEKRFSSQDQFSQNGVRGQSFKIFPTNWKEEGKKKKKESKNRDSIYSFFINL